MEPDEQRCLAERLGASRVEEVRSKRVAGPLDLLALRAEFESRLRSSGGRPTDPAWTIERQVPFKEASWRQLQELAGDVARPGRRVAAAHVAAVLIETGLRDLEDAEWDEALRSSRSRIQLSQPETAAAAGMTCNQLDDWAQRGWLIPAARRGHERFFGADEVIRAVWLRQVASLVTEVAQVAADIRRVDLAARYLLLTNLSEVSTAEGRDELYRRLEEPGSHLVIDQLPERRKLLGAQRGPDNDKAEEQTRQAL